MILITISELWGPTAPFFMSPREDLLERIETYADAKVSGSDRLIALASRHLAQLLREVDIVAPVAVPEQMKQQVEAQLPPVKKTTRKRKTEA